MEVLFPLLFRFRARGTEHVPLQGPALLLVNHQSYLDPIILGLPLKRPIVMLARENLFCDSDPGSLSAPSAWSPD